MSLARWAPFSHLPSFSSCLLSSSPRPPPPPHLLTFPLLEKFRDRGDYGGGCLDAWLLRGYSRWHCLVRLPGCRRGVQTCPRVRALRSLADVGHCRYYREGRGVERNAVKAAKWAGKAVAQGHVTWRTD